MKYYYVKNWRRFQHYKHRNPPWIKLHQEIFTSEDWVAVSDASKLLAIVCMVLAAKHDGKVPDSPAYIKRLAYLDTIPNLKPLIECGFLSETLADASAVMQVRTNAEPESRVQSPETESKLKANGNGKVESKQPSRSKKPPHGKRTKDGKRLWLDAETSEWRQYADDFREAHNGIDPKLEWDGTGSWFNSMGEIQPLRKTQHERM